MTTTNPFTFATTPYPFFVGEDVLPAAAANALLEWAEAESTWRRVDAPFYSQYETPILRHRMNAALSSVLTNDFFAGLIRPCSELFTAPLCNYVKIVAHKLVPGQQIGVHNDAPLYDGADSHRVVLFLARDWCEEDGGELLLLNSANMADIGFVQNPTHNTCLAMELSEHSHHAVMPVVRNDRYSLVFSFYRQPDQLTLSPDLRRQNELGRLFFAP